MAQDNSNYEIVQISEADWGIQYFGGPLETGFPTRQAAIDYAADYARNNQIVTVVSTPRNLDEAIVKAQEARDTYRVFVGENPTATEEAKEAKLAEIAAADAFVSEYQNQLEKSRKDASVKRSLEQLDLDTQLKNADIQRKDKSKKAVAVRKDPASQPNDIETADNEAFDAELYFESILRKVQAAIEDAYEQSNSTSSLFSGGSQSFTNFGGQVITTNTEISTAGTSNFDIIRSTLNNEFGSISTIQGSAGSAASGYGSTQYAGTTVYSTSGGGLVNNEGADTRVKLKPKPSQASALFSGILQPLSTTGGLVFPYTPEISYSGSANYNTLEPVHANQTFEIYKNTPSVELQINGKFTAQNDVEASYLLAALHFVRVLTKMHFGDGDSNRGLPPPQLILDGYGTHMFNGLSVILMDYSIQLPDDIDYVQVQSAGGTSEVPSLCTLSVRVKVQQTPAKAREFNWDSFASGDLLVQKKGWL